MREDLERRLRTELDALRGGGSYKTLKTLQSPQGPWVEIAGHGRVLVLCSNDYLGLAGHPAVVEAGIEGLRRYGAGTASVRFVCGTFDPHMSLEEALADLVGTGAALTYSSCWAANEATISTLADDRTVVLSDELNHASIIDAIHLSRTAHRLVYPHADMAALRDALESCAAEDPKLIVTDGVFSMEGDVAPLPDILELARGHRAVVVVDDSHGTGVLGEGGRGTAEHLGVLGEVDVVTSTLGKALGGAAGGFVASSRTVCDYLLQRSRPHIFSNPIPPTSAASAAAALAVLRASPDRLRCLHDNVASFRGRLVDAGFRPLSTPSAILPIILGDEALTERFSARLLEEGVLVTAFRYPVVPRGEARVRVQLSAALSTEDLDFALDVFVRAGHDLALI